MTITVGSFGSGAGQSGTLSVSLSATTAGSTIVVFTQNLGTTTKAVSDNASNTYVSKANAINVDRNWCEVFICENATSTTQVSVDSNYGQTSLMVVEVKGVLTSGGTDKVGTATAGYSTANPLSYTASTGTLSQADEICLYMWSNYYYTATSPSWASTATPGTWTTIGTLGGQAFGQYQIVSATSSLTMSGTLGYTGDKTMTGAYITLKAPGGGTTVYHRLALLGVG